MTSSETVDQTPSGEEPARRGGLPEDDGSLDAFTAAAQGAFKPRRRRSRSEDSSDGSETSAPDAGQALAAAVGSEVQPAVVSVPAPAAEPARVPVTRSAPAAPAERVLNTRALEDGTAIAIPELGDMGKKATQCTVMVTDTVRDRFAHYQLTKKMETGREPTNAIVVRRAVLHARKHDLFAQLLESVRHRQQPVDEEDFDEDDLFGDVPGRRTDRGRTKNGVQQSFRPSFQELAVIDALSDGYGFPSRSEFVDAALDAFLPPLPATGRRK